MIVYNVTVKVNPEIEREWIQWQKEEHIPEILSTRHFVNHGFFRLLNTDESDGITYVLQFFAEDLYHFNEFESKYAAELHAKAFTVWGNKFVYFTSIMQVVH